MAESEALDRQKTLELTYEEANNLIERQRAELQNQRKTALRTLRATLVLIGVLITFSYQFSGVIQSFTSRPFQPTLSNILGGILISLAAMFLVLSPILLTFSLKDAQFSRSVDPWDLRSLSTGSVEAVIGNEVRHPSHKPDDWHQFMIHEYSTQAADNEETLRYSSLYLRFGHLFLAMAPMSFMTGLWLSM